MDTYSTAEIEEILDISNTARQKYQRAKFLRPVGGKPYRWAKDQIDALVPYAAIKDPALLVRMGGPGKDSDGRKIGWSEDYSPEEKIEAVRKWWRIADPQSWHGEEFVALLGDWVVGAWRITDSSSGDWGGKTEFFIEEDSALTVKWAGKRLPIPQGVTNLTRWPRPE